MPSLLSHAESGSLSSLLSKSLHLAMATNKESQGPKDPEETRSVLERPARG